MNLPDMSKVPGLYSQENKNIEETIIYQKWVLPFVGFYWLISEFNPIDQIAFGFCNLNDDQNAEWGYVHLPEIIKEGAFPLDGFEPTRFGSIQK
jgi:hypothetical protein